MSKAMKRFAIMRTLCAVQLVPFGLGVCFNLGVILIENGYEQATLGLVDANFALRQMEVGVVPHPDILLEEPNQTLVLNPKYYPQPLKDALGRLAQGHSQWKLGIILVGLLSLLGLWWMKRNWGLNCSYPDFSHGRSPLVLRANTYRICFDSFVKVCVRDENTKALIADIMQTHDDQVKEHPRTRWWRVWIHGCMIAALSYHVGLNRLLEFPSRYLAKLIETFTKIRFR